MKKLLLFSALVLICSTLFAQTPSNWLTFDTKQQPTTAGRLVVAQKSSFGLSLNDDLTQLNVSDDDLGHKHYRYQQTYQNYPVEGAQLLVHENQYGLVYAANGGLVRNINQNADVVWSEQAALDKALAYSKGKTFAWQDANYQKALQHATENDKATFYPKGELVWASNSPKQEPQSYKLSYKFDVFSTQPLSRKFIFVDAQTGELVTEQNQLHDADAPCTGTARYSCSNPVSITADNQGSFYRLRESSNNRKIETYTANNGTAYAFFDITSTDNNFNEDQTATAVHWSTEKTYDYFKNTHNRNSFDGTNSKLMSWVHFDTGYDNAFWNGSWMSYGDGSMFSPLVSTDIVGHEIGHGITQYTANLTYSYEPGALNESFSDIFGTVVEFYADPTCADWKIGEDITANYNGGQGIRNMQNPNLHGQPDTYEGTNWEFGSWDYGGVHINSGVQNYWFYLLCQGGSGTNDHNTAYNVTPIGMTKAARIAYRMLTVYLTATSQYSDARIAAISATTDLYGASSPELTQVVNAWCAVGVGSCALNTGTIAVTSPNGGEVWLAGSTRNITWTSTGTVTNVDIYYSTDGGTTWNFIANQANTGSYIWTVANTPTTLAQVRVTNSGNASITDDSNANFTIQGCNVLAGFSTTSNTVCIPTTLSFSNTSTGATTYEWKVNNLTQGTSTNLSYNFTTEGIYSVQLTAVNGTCSDTYTQTITVNPAPDATFTHTETDLTFNGFATQLSANSYTWNFGDGNTSTTQNATHTYAAAGTYNVCLTVTNGCGSVSSCQSVTLNDNSNTACWQSISAGLYHTVAIKTDGTLWAWGGNWVGQLGDGTNIIKNIPTQIATATNWQSISTGWEHTIALKTDGTLWAWGSNWFGQLGYGYATPIPTQIGTDTNWQSISAGGGHTVAIKADGTLWAWGGNYYGQLGDGTFTRKDIPTQIGTETNWQSISAGGGHTVALKIDGTLWAWGHPLFNGSTTFDTIPTQIGTATNWQSISAGYEHTIAIKTDGTLWAWGNNMFGQLGDGTTTHKYIPTQIGTANNWQSISPGYMYTIALKTDGTLWAWGDDEYGQLGDSTNANKSIPTQIGTANNWQNISAGSNHTAALKIDGTLWAWGYNGYGQLGDGTSSIQKSPTHMDTANNWQSISTKNNHIIAVKTDGTLWAWGNNMIGRLGDGTTTNKAIPTQIGTVINWQNISAGWEHTIAIKTDGTLWAWGNNGAGQLGDGTYSSKNIPTQIGTDTNWQSISAGISHTIAIKTDGTLWAWGQNNYGQLGDGTNTDKNIPAQIGTDNNWKSISAGVWHTVALKTDGTLWAWGNNGYGQLGDGTNTDKNTPTQIGTDTNWQSISAEWNHSTALKTDGTLWAWGYNEHGQLGDGTITNKTIPTQIGTANNWQSISVGHYHSVALKTDGTLWAWGNNHFGQLGDGTTTDKTIPIQISTANNWQSISVGHYHSVALKTDGTLWTWGHNEYGQLGNGTAYRNTPIQPVGGSCTAPTCPITPQFTNPNTSTCSNTPYTFTNTSTGATAYQWLVNGTATSTATNLTYTFPTQGTYTITLEASNGTCSETYSQTITVNGSATQLNLGTDVMQCGSSSVALDCGISGALFYNWDLNGTLVGTTQSITATQSGTYYLSVMDACNQVGIDTISVLLDDDCVWPGDVNYDNIVNYLDLLPVGLNYGASGSTRPNANFAFNAQPCQDWNGTQANEPNLKHADCNGNGIIDNNDPAAIQQNYSQTHGTAPANPVNSTSPIALSAALGTAPASFSPNTIVRIDLYANNTQNLNVTAYGFGFDINYQFPNCVKVNSAYIDFTGSWLGTNGVDMATVQKNFLNSNLKSGHIEVAMTRLNHQNQNGYGKVGTLVADVDIYATTGSLQAAASMSGQQMTVANGNLVPIGGISGSFNLVNPAAPTVTVAANPTTALIGGTCTSTLTATVGNCSGCTYQWKRNSTVISGATSTTYAPTQTGTYYVIVTGSNGLSASASVSVAYNNAIVNNSGVALPFCTPTGINSSAEYIKSVQFGTDAANITVSDNGYGNFTCSKVFNVPVSCSATLTLQPKFVGATQTEYWTVWIDKNMDGDFVDAGEQIWQKTTTNGNAFSKTFLAANIPSTLLGKNFRMRVAMKRSSYATSPCENFAYGEVEDYTLRFVASSCKTDETAGVEDETTEAFADMPLHLFPNPVSDQLTVNFIAQTEEQITIRVYDIIGRLVFEEPIWSMVGENTAQISTQQLPQGIYLLQISGNDTQNVQRFVKR